MTQSFKSIYISLTIGIWNITMPVIFAQGSKYQDAQAISLFSYIFFNKA